MAFMEGRGGEEGWGEVEDDSESDDDDDEEANGKNSGGSRVGRWESGKGRCAVTGRRVLGGTDGLRRIMI